MSEVQWFANRSIHRFKNNLKQCIFFLLEKGKKKKTSLNLSYHIYILSVNKFVIVLLTVIGISLIKWQNIDFLGATLKGGGFPML